MEKKYRAAEFWKASRPANRLLRTSQLITSASQLPTYSSATEKITAAESASGTPSMAERLAVSSTTLAAPSAETTANVVTANSTVMSVTARYVAIGTVRLGSLDSSP